MCEIEDPDGLTVKMMGVRNQLEQLVNCDELKDDWVMMLVHLFAKVCEATTKQSINTMLAMLSDSKYLNKHLLRCMIQWRLTEEEDFNEKVANGVLKVAKKFTDCFPSRFMDLPLDAIQSYVNGLQDEELDLQVI